MPLIRTAAPEDAAWIDALLDEEWGGPDQVVDGRAFRPAELPGSIAEIDGERVGYAALEVQGTIGWIALIHALHPRQGVGRALVDALTDEALDRGCEVMRVVTTNDNVDAQRFYRALGFEIREIRSGAVNEARRIKPAIPLSSADGIPITDEIEFERRI